MIKNKILNTSFSFLSLNFKHRRIIHYTLLGCIIFLQTIAIVIWNNETSSESEMSKALDSMDYFSRISSFRNRINNSFIYSQKKFNSYTVNKDSESLEKYTESLSEIEVLIDSLVETSKENKEFQKILGRKKQLGFKIQTLKSKIDSIISLDYNQHTASQPLLLKLNNELLELKGEVMPIYSRSINDLHYATQQELKKDYKTNKEVRGNALVIFRALMILISLAIFYFTRAAFQYENRLTATQRQIRENLNFKNRIMGMISHEIRSPLKIIYIYSKMISSSIKDPEIKETFQSIQFTTNSLVLLANQILEYSKDEKRLLELHNNKFNLKSEIDQIVSSLGSLVESKGNRLNVVSNLTDQEVYSDAVKIHQLFYNIIGNANKFTAEGVILIDMTAEKTEDRKINLMVKIKDDGAGISENDLKNIFKLHYQGTVSRKVNDLGAGLGLNLCKEIIELFGGSIHVQSKMGEGTEVSFNLKLNLV